MEDAFGDSRTKHPKKHADEAYSATFRLRKVHLRCPHIFAVRTDADRKKGSRKIKDFVGRGRASEQFFDFLSGIKEKAIFALTNGKEA